MSIQEERQAARLAEIFSALSNVRRMVILDCLLEGERTVGSVSTCDRLQPSSHPNTSQHLGVLRRAGLVTERREGTHVFYSLAPGVAGLIRTARDLDKKRILALVKEGTR